MNQRDRKSGRLPLTRLGGLRGDLHAFCHHAVIKHSKAFFMEQVDVNVIGDLRCDSIVRACAMSPTQPSEAYSSHIILAFAVRELKLNVTCAVVNKRAKVVEATLSRLFDEWSNIRKELDGDIGISFVLALVLRRGSPLSFEAVAFFHFGDSFIARNY